MKELGFVFAAILVMLYCVFVWFNVRDWPDPKYSFIGVLIATVIYLFLFWVWLG